MFPSLNLAILLATGVCERYTWDGTWPKDNISWYNDTAKPTAVALGTAANGDLEVHVTQRGHQEFPITTFDYEGNVLRRWGAPHVLKSHGLRYVEHGGQAYLWVTDTGDFTVKKFDARSGKLLQTLGTPGEAGTKLMPLQFGNVSDIVFSPDHEAMFIADGDCLCRSGGTNHRVVKVSTKSLEVQWAVGNDGSFQNPHAIDYDEARDWIWIADREHNRTVALDASTGEFMSQMSVHDLAPAEHPPSINGLRVDNRNDALILGLLPAPVLSSGGIFQVAAWDLQSSVASKKHVSLYQQEIPLRGLHELAVHDSTGDLYLALYEAGYFGRLLFAGKSADGQHGDGEVGRFVI